MKSESIKPVVCPNCGAPIDGIPPGGVYSCGYCGSSLYVGKDLHKQLVVALHNILLIRQAEESAKRAKPASPTKRQEQSPTIEIKVDYTRKTSSLDDIGKAISAFIWILIFALLLKACL